MVTLQHDPDLIFGGTAEPAAFFEVFSIGFPERAGLEKLTTDLNELLDEVLGLPAARVFIRYVDLPPELLAIGGALRG